MQIIQDTRRIGLHILFWILFISYEVSNYGWSNTRYFHWNATHELWTDLPMMIVIVYVNLYWLMPKFLYPKKYVAYIFSLFFILLLGGLYARYMGYRIWTPWDKTHNYQDYLEAPKQFFIPIRIIRNTINFYPLVALTMLIKVLRNSYRNEKYLRETDAEKHRAELSFLKAQIHPHFFFNTLSSLYALILKKSDKSAGVVMTLSGLMRYMLYESNAEMVLLEDEINYLKNYISIEELRFGDRLDLSFQYSGNIQGKLIAPLVLLPFVENAFKHSLNNETQKAWITIDIKVTGNELFFKTENSYQKINSKIDHEGMGLKNVKKRLHLVYPGKHSLVIKDGEVFFITDLKMQLNEKN